jgi:UDP-glucose 4-epimerase
LLTQQGFEIVVVDRTLRSKTGVAVQVLKIGADVARLDEMRDIFGLHKPDAVLHLAANSSLQESVTNPIYDATQNILGTLSVINAAKNSGCRRIVFASTSAVYGPKRSGEYSEDDPVRPKVGYGVSKAAGEMYVRSSGLSYAILRYGNVYGPGQKPLGENILIARALAHMLGNEPFKINGDGEQIRDWVYVMDVAVANFKALFSNASGTFNIATGKGATVNQVVGELKKLTGFPDKIKHGPSKSGELQKVIMNSQKAGRVLDWHPRTPVTFGLEQTFIKWTS